MTLPAPPGRLTLASLVTACLLAASAPATGEAPAPWTDVSERTAFESLGHRVIHPARARYLALDRGSMERLLARAPLEGEPGERLLLPLPRPDGTTGWFRVEEAPIMEPELAARFPQLKTYRGQGVDDPTATLRCDLTPGGFRAQVLRAEGAYYIDPLFQGGDVLHQSYFRSDFAGMPGEEPFECHIGEEHGHGESDPSPLHSLPAAPSGATLRTYRLALAGTGEYTTKVCEPGPAAVACGLAAMVTSMNRVNGVYEREVAILMVLVANNHLLVYTDGTKDPYTNGNGSTMLGENQANLDAVIGDANYDIGHVFSTGGGGVAYLGVPCRTSWKARGVTGRSNPVGDPFDIDYVAHEMGHQWGAHHTFNGTTGSCGGGNRSASSAYEPGSGSTIMAYAGICGTENLQLNSDPYFHTRSYDQILAYSTGGSGNLCGQHTATGNGIPVVNAGPAFTVPMQTPFTLTGSATDPDGDSLTFGWEEFDLGTLSPPQGDATAARPIFRSFNPTPSPSRTFPRMADVLAGTQTFGEWMSQRNRTMTFRLTTRDNRAGGGGVDYAATSVTVTTSAGPFTVTQPASGTTWNGGSDATVTWNVAGTTASPVSCSHVDILLSTDGGATFPIALAENTPNDGSQVVVAPAVATTQGRVMVACRGNVFFNVSRPDFTITYVGTRQVAVTVQGLGGVTSSPPGIDCPGTCQGEFHEGSTVTLTATPVGGWEFSGWSGGGCSGTDPCAIQIPGEDVTVTAVFTNLPTQQLAVSVAGPGTVTSSPGGIGCPGVCQAAFDFETEVTLTAEPDPGVVFAGWSGSGCSGTGPCVVTMDRTRAATAAFGQFLSGDVNGDGLVNAGDVFYLINYLFAGGPAPIGSGDVNGDGLVNAGDVFYLINYLFAGGPAPV